MADHKALTTTDLHEPKDVAAANNHEVYRADGAGSGDWEKITEDSIDSTAAAGATDVLAADGANGGTFVTLNNMNRVSVTYKFEDISTGASQWVPMPLAGKIIKIYSVLHGVIATADAAFTFEIAGTLITSGALTIAFSGSAAGDLDNSSPSAANVVTAGQAVELISNGASTNDVDAAFTFVLDTS